MYILDAEIGNYKQPFINLEAAKMFSRIDNNEVHRYHQKISIVFQEIKLKNLEQKLIFLE